MGKDDSKKNKDREQDNTASTINKTETTASTSDTTILTPNPEPNKEQKRQLDPLKDFVDYVRFDGKAQRFMIICVAAGKYSKPEDLKDELTIRQFLADFEAWKKAGEPGASMPRLPKSDIKFPTAIYRLRDRMEDKMYVYFSDGTELGVQYIPRYEQIENPVTGELENSTIKIGQTEAFDMEFSEKKAKKLIEDYNKLAPPGTNALGLYYWIGDNKQKISEKNFFKPHDEIVELLNNKKPLA